MEIFVLFAILATLLWGFGDFFLSKATKKVGDFLPLIFIGFVGAVVFAPKAIPLLHYLTSANVLTLTILGLLHFGMGYFLFEAYRRGKLSVIEVLFQLEMPFTVILAIIFLKESLSASTIFLITLILVGSLLLSNILNAKKSNFENGWKWALAAAIFSATTNLVTAVSAKTISPLLAVWFPWVILFLISFIFLWKEFDHIIIKAKSEIVILLTVAVFQVGAWISYSYALSGKNLSIVGPIIASYCVIAAFLGYWINEEKLNHWQITGAAITIVASILIAINF